MAGDLTGEARDQNGVRVVLPTELWRGKILRDHPEMTSDLSVWQPEGSTLMERVNITIGPVTFDRADYDAENDVLYLHVGEPQEAEGEETPEGHVLRYAPGSQWIIGLTVLGAQRILDREGELRITILESVKASADDLAPALAAI